MPGSAAHYLLTVGLALVALLAAGAAVARGGGDGSGGGDGPQRRGGTHERLDDDFRSGEYDAIRRLRQAGEILPLEQILREARRQRHGRVLETGLEQEHGRYIYNVELLDDKGKVWEMELDAATGEVLKNRQEN